VTLVGGNWSGNLSISAIGTIVLILKIDRWFPSSKRCSNCGHIVSKMPLNIREWDCPKCETHHDRDINAAKNILAAGLAVAVCGATVRPEQSKSVRAGAKPRKGQKQKPKS
jgi:putative transposase